MAPTDTDYINASANSNIYAGANNAGVPTSVMMLDPLQTMYRLATIGDQRYPMLSNSEQAILQNIDELAAIIGSDPCIVSCPNAIAMEEAYAAGLADSMVLPIAHQETPRFAYQYRQIGCLVATVEALVLVGTEADEKTVLDGVYLMSKNPAHDRMVDNLISEAGFLINRRITEGVGNTVAVTEALINAGRNGANQAGITTRRSMEFFKAKGHSLYEWRELKQPFELVWVIYQ